MDSKLVTTGWSMVWSSSGGTVGHIINQGNLKSRQYIDLVLQSYPPQEAGPVPPEIARDNAPVDVPGQPRMNGLPDPGLDPV